MDLLERIDWVLKQRGTNPNRWSEDAGLTRTHVRTMRSKLKKNVDPNPTRHTMEALAKAANISLSWFLTGIGAWEPYEGEPAPGTIPQAPPGSLVAAKSPEPPPVTPPAKSDVREKYVVDHWFPDEVEDTFVKAVKIQAHIDYPARQSRPAKVFLRESKAEMAKGYNRVDLMIAALEAARELDEEGIEPTEKTILGRLIQKAMAKRPPPPPGESSLARRLREAHEANLRNGIEADVPSWVPRPGPVPDVPGLTPLEFLPRPAAPALPPAPEPEPAPPPASGPVAKRSKNKGAR